MSTSDSESAEDQVPAKFLGGWRFPAALKHITAQLVSSRPGQVGVAFHRFHIAEVVCLRAFILFRFLLVFILVLQSEN